MRKKNKELNENLKNALGEIKDLQQEQELEKEDLCQTIRVTEQENKFLTKIIDNIFNHGEIEKLKYNAYWNEEKNEYNIKPFVLKGKTINFPKLKTKESLKFTF